MNKLRKYLVVVGCVLVLTTNSFAGDAFAIGMRAFNLRDYTTAMLRLSEEARSGEELAQELVAQFFAAGHAAPKDPYEALYWYSRAGKTAENSPPVRSLEEEGYELPESDAMTLKLYLEQASAGDLAAAYRLGNMYAWARGTKQDFKLAFDWYKNAAQKGHAYAQFELARFYYNGQGTVKDLERALAWMKRAADKGVTLAKYHYADFLRTGKTGHEDPVAARKYYADAANDGYGLAQFELVQFLLPEANDFESRVEVLKWIFLYAAHFEKQLSPIIVLEHSSQLDDVQNHELFEAKKRARAFVRADG